MRRMLLLLAVAGCMLAVLTASAPRPWTTISVISTNDFHGALIGEVQPWSRPDAVGGAAWLAGYVNAVRAENKGAVLWLDAGDALRGSRVSDTFYGAPTIDVFNAAGVSAMVPGNHDFGWGHEILEQRASQANFPLLGANVSYARPAEERHGARDRHPHWLLPYAIVEMQGVKVGIIGVELPETSDRVTPGIIDDLTFTDPAPVVNAILPRVEAQGATVIVVVAHIGGYMNNRDQVVSGPIADLACSLDATAVDLILSGDSQTRLDDMACGIPIVQAYSHGIAFSRVDFTVNRTTGEAIAVRMNAAPTICFHTRDGEPATYQRWDTGEHVRVQPDSEVQAVVDRYSSMLEAANNTTIGETSMPIKHHAQGESSLGDWVTDTMRSYDEHIDFAVLENRLLRESIDEGPITRGEVLNALTYGETLVLAELTGTELRQLVEEMLSRPRGLQVSGLRLAYDLGLPGGARLVGDVTDLRTGQPVSPESVYTVAVAKSMAFGEHAYLALRSNRRQDTYTLISDLGVVWVQTNSPFSPPVPALESRITAYETRRR